MLRAACLLCTLNNGSLLGPQSGPAGFGLLLTTPLLVRRQKSPAVSVSIGLSGLLLTGTITRVVAVVPWNSNLS